MLGFIYSQSLLNLAYGQLIKGALSRIMMNELTEHTIASKFISLWRLHNSGLVCRTKLSLVNNRCQLGTKVKKDLLTWTISSG